MTKRIVDFTEELVNDEEMINDEQEIIENEFSLSSDELEAMKDIFEACKKEDKQTSVIAAEEPEKVVESYVAPNEYEETDEENEDIDIYSNIVNTPTEASISVAEQQAQTTPNSIARKPRGILEAIEQSRVTANFTQTKSDDIEGNNVKACIQAVRRGTVLWGKVVNVIPVVVNGANDIEITVYIKGFPCKIMYKDFVLPNLCKDLSSDTVFKSEINKLVGMMHSNVPVILTNLKRVENILNPTKTSIKLVGSRVKAMEARQEKYFYHRKKRANAKTLINANDVVVGNVIAVYEQLVILEILGVQVNLDVFNSSIQYVENCHDLYKVGDQILVLVKKCFVTEDGKINLKVSARSFEFKYKSKVNIKEIREGGFYAGRVKFRADNGMYYIVFDETAVVALIPSTRVIGRTALVPGDRVSVKVTGITAKGSVYGTVLKTE